MKIDHWFRLRYRQVCVCCVYFRVVSGAEYINFQEKHVCINSLPKITENDSKSNNPGIIALY